MNETNATPSVRYDSTTPPDNERHSLQAYVSDMLALEHHIREPIDRQLGDKDAANYTAALQCIASIKSINASHISALETELKRLGGHAGSPIKSAWSSLLGVGAAAVDSVRKTRVSKNLRDDYTALSLAVISYEMLNATALGVGDETLASLAERHLNDFTPIIMQLGRVMPEVVLEELQVDGEIVDPSAASRSRDVVEKSWRHHSA